jgi:malonate transporter MadL subunit
MLIGAFIGELIGKLIGIDANVGGVGISMLLLILVASKAQASGRLSPIAQTGITFWSAIYIPVVVAMAASQNVVAAVRGGAAAVLAGVLAVVVCCALLPWRWRSGGDPPPPLPDASSEQGT